MIVFDASAVVSAALRADSVPERALPRAEAIDVFALSAEVDAEITEVLNRFALRGGGVGGAARAHPRQPARLGGVVRTVAAGVGLP